MTKGQTLAGDIAALLRARNPILWVVSREEARVEALLFEASKAAGYLPYTWDIAQGACDLAGKPVPIGDPDPGAMLAAIRERSQNGNERNLWILRDIAPLLSGPVGIVNQRALRNIARLRPTMARDRAQAVVVLTPSADIPAELAGHATLVDVALPDREEIAAILDTAVENNAEALPELRSSMLNGTRDACIDAAVGLSEEEAASCYGKSLVQLRRIDPLLVAKEKKRVIARERVLEWYDPLPGGLGSVGGLENLKSWLVARKAAYSAKARAYGLPAPRGALLVGVPGCGKSLTAKAIATAWGVPLLRLDLGGLKSKYVGESEGNLRKAFRTIEAVGRCVVWLDEIEKALAGATQGAADGGVSSDALGAILSWMQERTSEAFVIATANDVSALPPELLRKGRWDELWFVDLPTQPERESILQATLATHGRKEVKLDVRGVALECTDFTGAEIAALVPDAMYAAFADGEREINTIDLLDAAKTVSPLAKTAADKVNGLRAWAKGRARPASAALVETTAKTSGVDL